MLSRLFTNAAIYHIANKIGYTGLCGQVQGSLHTCPYDPFNDIWHFTFNQLLVVDISLIFFT